ncbi:hypothetical protein [Absidia glauca]|uniref:Retrotransposon gag domain-containing protein n=1 Tax=Absidia glauca TaxID=4829 RepID=A0A168QGR2_ABSGL|nr:hypothetical protein [Absidia glauca]
MGKYNVILGDLLRRVNEIQTISPENETLKRSLETLEHRLIVTEGGLDHTNHYVTEQDSDDHRRIYDHLATNYLSVSGSPGVTVTNEPKPRIKVKEPMVFSGRPRECNVFFSQLSLCFAVNQHLYPSDFSEVLFATSYLVGNAFAYMQPFLSKRDKNEEPPEILTNFATFKQVLTGAFGDPNPVVNAGAALRALKQNGPASVYVTEFRRLSMLLSWNEAALISHFIVGLKDGIQDELGRRDLIDNLDELVGTTIDIINRIYQRNRLRKQQPGHGHSKPSTSSNHLNGAQPLNLSVVNCPKKKQENVSTMAFLHTDDSDLESDIDYDSLPEDYYGGIEELANLGDGAMDETSDDDLIDLNGDNLIDLDEPADNQRILAQAIVSSMVILDSDSEYESDSDDDSCCTRLMVG